MNTIIKISRAIKILRHSQADLDKVKDTDTHEAITLAREALDRCQRLHSGEHHSTFKRLPSETKD